MVFLTMKGLRMDRCLKQWIALALSLLYVYGSIAVVRGEPNEISPGFESQLKSLQRALDDAELANCAVRLELDEARDTLYNDDWLNQERAESVMSLVQDILADSTQRMNLFGDGAMMGWNNGFYLASADGQFRLNVGGLLQTQLMSRWQGVNSGNSATYDEWRYGMGVSRTELNFGGHAFGRGLSYYIELGWGSADPYDLTNQGGNFIPRMWDAWIAFQLNSETSIKIGQFSLPFTKEGLIKSPYQMAVFSTLVEHRMGLEQSQGVEVNWNSNHRKFSLALSNGSPALFQGPLWGNWTAGVAANPAWNATPPWPALQRDTLYAVTMRHEWKVLGDWDQFEQFTSPPGSERGVLIGVAGHRQNNEVDSPDTIGGFPDGVFWGVTGDIMMQFDGASIFASVIYERVLDVAPLLPRINILTFVAQGSTYITNQTELFARWESGGPDREAIGGDILQILTLGVNHYIDGQDVKVTADLGFSFGEVSATMANTQSGWVTDPRRRNQMMFRTQLQLMF